MGGYGSGRTGGWPTIEGCQSLVLSSDEIIRSLRQAFRKIGADDAVDKRDIDIAWHPWRWTRTGDDDPWATVEMRFELRQRHGTVWLRYDVDHVSRSTGPQEYSISLATTPCRFGGVRWWFICPSTRRKVGKLYLPNGGVQFLSRGQGAYQFAYHSQRGRIFDRMHARNRRMYRLLGADYHGSVDAHWPPKPKGMHWRTYNDICARMDEAEERMNEAMVPVLAQFQRKYRVGTRVP